MKVIANRQCIVGPFVYEAGDVIDHHDYAEQLVAYGFADEVDLPAPDATTVADNQPDEGASEEDQ